MDEAVKTFRIGIDARMFSTRFTGIGRYTQELIRRITVLRPHWHFTVFLAPAEFENFTPEATNVEKVLAPEEHYSWQEQTSFLKKINAQKFDLFHFPHFNAPVLYKGKSIVTIHDLTISFFPGKKKKSFLDKLAYKFVLKSILRRAKRIITVSEYTKMDLQKLFAFSSDKVRVIWNGLSEEFFRAAQDPALVAKRWGELENVYKLRQPYFLYAGVHREHKNVVGMLRAYSQFLKNGGQVDLVMTGKEDPFYPEINATIAKEGLGERVKKVGLVTEEELRALFFNAHAFIFPSFYEGFGFPPLEAMAMEIPVITSNASAMPEICGDAVEYFDPYILHNMSEKMQLIAENDTRRRELIARGRERVKLFSWGKMADETLRVYEEVLFAK